MYKHLPTDIRDSLKKRGEADVDVEGVHPVPLLPFHVYPHLPHLRGHLLSERTRESPNVWGSWVKLKRCYTFACDGDLKPDNGHLLREARTGGVDLQAPRDPAGTATAVTTDNYWVVQTTVNDRPVRVSKSRDDLLPLKVQHEGKRRVSDITDDASAD